MRRKADAGAHAWDEGLYRVSRAMNTLMRERVPNTDVDGNAILVYEKKGRVSSLYGCLSKYI